MSITTLVPGNTQRARLTALNSFELFLANEKVAKHAVDHAIVEDGSGAALVLVMDKYALHLACKNGGSGKSLAKTTVSSCFGNVKNHYLEMFAVQRAICEKKLAKIGATLETHCSKKGDVFVHKAPACTKSDLQALSSSLYRSATSANDYGDAALLIVLWYLFGRSSDTTWLLKNQLTIYPSGVLFFMFKRMKSSNEQGVALFKDRDHFASCPVYTLAVATIMQSLPCAQLLGHLPVVQGQAPLVIDDDLSLMELIENQIRNAGPMLVEGGPSKKRPKSAQGIHSHVNRLLRRVLARCKAEEITVTPALTSHSFRRGAAQSANADAKLSTNWILDRGGWNMSSLSKGFAYIVNITQEDQKVAKTLSVCATHALRADVLEVFAAAVIMHFSKIANLRPTSPYMVKFESALAELEISTTKIRCWSLTIRAGMVAGSPTNPSIDNGVSSTPATLVDLIREQSGLLRNLAAHNRLMVLQNKELLIRLERLEQCRESRSPPSTGMPPAAAAIPCGGSAAGLPVDAGDLSKPAKKRKKPNAPSKSLKIVRFEWFSGLLWKTAKSKQRAHEFKAAVAFMKLFLPNGFDLQVGNVLEIGAEAERNALTFLRSNGNTAKSYGTVVTALKALNRDGRLSDLVVRYEELKMRGAIVDTSPPEAMFSLYCNRQRAQQV